MHIYIHVGVAAADALVAMRVRACWWCWCGLFIEFLINQSEEYKWRVKHPKQSQLVTFSQRSLTVEASASFGLKHYILENYKQTSQQTTTDRQTYEINSPADNQQQTASQIFQRISGNCAKNQQKNYQKGLMCIFGNVWREFQTNINEN